MPETKEIKAIILDTETTGFNKINDPSDPIWVAYLSFAELSGETEPQNRKTFSQKYNPSKPINPGASKVHGFYKKDLLEFSKYTFTSLEIPESVEYLIAHNNKFDWEVIRSTRKFKRICTIKLYKALYPEIGKYALKHLIETLYPDIASQLLLQAHGAVADARLTLLLINKVLEDFEISSWEEIYQLGGVDA